MAQRHSGWNSFFHQNNANDTSYNHNGPVTGTIPNGANGLDSSSQRVSYFRLREDLGYDYDVTNDIPLSSHAKHVKDVERGGGYPNSNNPFQSNEEQNSSTPYWIPSNTPSPLNGVSPLPSAPPASDLRAYYDDHDEASGAVAFAHGNGLRARPTLLDTEPDEITEIYDDKQIGEENDEALARRLYREEKEQFYRSPPGENETYKGAQAGFGSSGTIPLIDPKLPKALSDPKVIRQLQRRRAWRPWFTWIVSIIQIIVLILEFVNNNKNTGSLIMTNPFNPMIGPSAETLILMGARFTPCMREIPGTNTSFACQNSTEHSNCTLEEYCGLNGFHRKIPDQWYRFIVPIFLHGGLVHIGFNLLFQLQTGTQVERDIGFHRYSLIYMASGIFGFIFGGNFAPDALPSTGASGSLFGIIGILLLDLIQNWKLIINPCWELTKMLLMIGVSFLLGLLPGLDNFSHIGGFVMGLITGLVLMPTINFSKLHKRATWFFRIAALPIAILLFVLLIKNFYSGNPTEKCPWCKYLSCLPVNGWCDTNFTNFKNITKSN
ncbi:hypothetical protein G9A89_019367 [Geosiphon pyriformis]|nr:hypothetical protein G9A89_019367 [Geosiphon pyriformis]